MRINLTNENTTLKQVKVGFSWTMFCFGGLVPLIRGHFSWFLLYLIVSVCTLGIGAIIMPFIYNGIYIKHLLNKGYKANDNVAKNILQSKGYIA